MKKLKDFFGKVRQSVQNYLSQKSVIGSFLQKYCESILSSKANVLSVSKEHFANSCKFLSDEVETIFWKSQAKRSELDKLQFDRGKLLRKLF